MSASPFSHLARATDEQLLRGLESLLAKERALEAELLAHIAEIDARKLYAERGFDSMFRYAVLALGLSESAAFHRIHAARCARRFPAVFERLATGQLHLSGIVVLAPVLTPNNHLRLLDAAAGLPRREIEELVVTLFPKIRTPDGVEPIPDQSGLPLDDDRGPSPRGSARPRRARKPRVEPLRDRLYKVQFTADLALREQLDELVALLRHQIPDGDLAEIFRRAVALLLEDTKRRRFARSDRPRKRKLRKTARKRRPSRHIPAAIKREVYERDRGRCSYVAPDGRPCESRDFLEFHHTEPWARTRRHRASEITLRCRAHNQLAARQDFGPLHMQRFEQSPGGVGPP